MAQQIVSGELPPGTRPTIRQLAEMLGISATPVREALVDLSVQGLVEALPNCGFRVRDLSSREVKEIYPLIAMLEVEALASAPLDEERIRRLRRINGSLREAVDRPLDSVRIDAEWHTTLLEGNRNATLHRYLGELRTRAWRYEVAYFSEGSRWSRSADRHDTVVDAVERGDMEQAFDALRENWMDGPRYLVPWLEARQRPS